MADTTVIKRALLSVYDKAGLLDLARALSSLHVEIIASGGTARALESAGLAVVEVEQHTGAREVLGGRVKTLHPKIHAGILADRRDPSHLSQLADQGYTTIDLVVCNLYPFATKLAEGADHATLVETIDIGGPTLVRAAAKNADGGVTTVCDPADYPSLMAQLAADGAVPLTERRRLAAKAFRAVASYDLAIAGWAEQAASDDGGTESRLPGELEGFAKTAELRYGENPHQAAALYVDQTTTGVAHGEVLCGKPLSYNNYLDMDGAYRAALMGPSDGHRCAIVKHTNPCGLAERRDQPEAFLRALAGDPVSAFGSILGFNRPLEQDTADAIRDKKLFVECIVAPDFTEGARNSLAKRPNLRLVRPPPGDAAPSLHAHRIGGGLLVQEVDPGLGDPSQWRCVTDRQLEAGWLEELAFAMTATALLKSNAIAITQDHSLLGAGAGQMSRVDACTHAITKAGAGASGAVFLGSDAFFPFDDCVRLAAEAGVVAIVQPGGSKRDDDSIKACNELGLCMVFTGRRHFRH